MQTPAPLPEIQVYTSNRPRVAGEILVPVPDASTAKADKKGQS